MAASLIENNPKKKGKNPVKFSDNAREIAMAQNRLEKQKMMEKMGMQMN
jgi:hypothetical protein